jgi:hypothetical protein
MISDTVTAQPLAASSRTAARVACAAAATFLVLLAALHVLKPEFDPSWRMISEYEIGRYGWVMMLAFLSLAFSHVCLVVALRAQVPTLGGTIGLILLLVSALGMAIAAIFTTDPITIAAGAVTPSGTMHGLGFFLGIPTVPIATTLLSISLARNPAWAWARRSLFWMTGLVWLSLAVFGLSILTLFKGTFGPDVPIGWQNRLVMLAYSGWVIVAAWRAAQLSRRSA